MGIYGCLALSWTLLCFDHGMILHLPHRFLASDLDWPRPRALCSQVALLLHHASGAGKDERVLPVEDRKSPPHRLVHWPEGHSDRSLSGVDYQARFETPRIFQGGLVSCLVSREDAWCARRTLEAIKTHHDSRARRRFSAKPWPVRRWWWCAVLLVVS